MSTIIKSKARVFGESINSFELLQALKSSLLKDDNAPIQISTPHHTGLLTMIVLCPHCNNLHFISQLLPNPDYIEKLSRFKILADHNNDKQVVEKKELIAVLETLTEPKSISLEDHNTSSYLLTAVYKCSGNCTVIHLDCSYSEDCIYPN